VGACGRPAASWPTSASWPTPRSSSVAFGQDAAGELLLLDYQGTLHRLARNPEAAKPDASSRFPRRLSDTGLFASTKDHKVAAGVIPYDVNAPLWSDGANKHRYLAVPGDGKIRYSPDAAWGFPDGSVLVKTFELEPEPGNPASRRRLETRLLHVEQEHWRGYTYVWNDDQTDAELLTDPRGRDQTFAVKDPAAPGGTRPQTWHYPSRAECTLCHTMPAGFVLGPNTLQMNRPFDYAAAAGGESRPKHRQRQQGGGGGGVHGTVRTTSSARWSTPGCSTSRSCRSTASRPTRSATRPRTTRSHGCQTRPTNARSSTTGPGLPARELLALSPQVGRRQRAVRAAVRPAARQDADRRRPASARRPRRGGRPARRPRRPGQVPAPVADDPDRPGAHAAGRVQRRRRSRAHGWSGSGSRRCPPPPAPSADGK
jgi:hypothetical protein